MYCNYKCSDEFTYFVDYAVTKIGLNGFDKKLLDKIHAILADYYTRVENSNLSQEQRFVYKSAIIGTILSELKIPLIYTNKVECAQKVFLQYERKEEIDQFVDWLKNNSISDNAIHNQLKSWTKETIAKTLENIKVSDKTTWTFDPRELKEIFKPLVEYVEEREKQMLN